MRRIEESAASRQAQIDSAREVIVGVNKYNVRSHSAFTNAFFLIVRLFYCQRTDSDPLDVRQIDNSQVRHSQIARLEHVRRERDAAKCEAALNALREAGASR